MQFRPHPYQQEAVSRMIRHDHYGLLLDMGLGKTVSVLSAIAALRFDYCAIGKTLVIAPLKVAEDTWQAEARKWDGLQGLTFSTVLGSEAKRKAALQANADVYVINRENVSWLADQYRYRLPFDVCVVDESSSFKNPSSRRFKALRKCLGSFKRVYILTGTPSPNTLMDLWAQVYLLDRGARLGQTITAYRQQYFLPGQSNGHVVYNWRLRDDAAKQAIYDRIQDICMSLSAADYLQLPPRIDNIVPVSLGDSMAVYKRMKHDLVVELQGKEITAANAAVLSNKLLQLANGNLYEDDTSGTHRGYSFLHREKLKKLKDIIEENDGKPVLVFYAFQHDRISIEQYLDKQVEELDGADTVRRWNAGEIRVLLAHPASCAYGLNLQAGGNVIVWYGLTWSLELYQQANARLYRQGQTQPVIIHHLVAQGTIDEQVMAALQRKKTGQDELLQAIKAHLKE